MADYSFWFEPIQNKFNKVKIVDHAMKNQSYFDICLNDFDLWVEGLDTVPSISADLLDLAVAIHAVDRIIERRKNSPYSFYVELPMRNHAVFLDDGIRNDLSNILEWYTGDCWQFTFSKRDVPGRPVEIQRYFPWKKPSPQPIEISLWSGGLDSLAGLHNRLLRNHESQHILIGAGANNQVTTSQKILAAEIAKLFPDRTTLIQIPYHWSGIPFSQKNFTQRARGLVFMLIGAACAYHFGSNALSIYENGIGAINLPYSKAEVGLDHARSVHPLSLFYLGDLISKTIRTQFDFSNPYMFWTKSQMRESLIKLNTSNLIHFTSSCDRPHRSSHGVIQCGSCSSCILRRQAIAALDIVDPTEYENGELIDKNECLHLRAMTYQLITMKKILNQSNPWYAFSSEYHELDDIVDLVSQLENLSPDIIRERIIQMYQIYISEWRLFKKYIQEKSVADKGTYAYS
jgi:hypothetical protein